MMRQSVPKDTDVLVVCGGLGTRLKAVSPDLPKGMVDIGGKPFIEILINQIERSGFQRIILCIGYQADVFKTYFARKKNSGIIFSEEVSPLGTAGAVKNAESHIKSSQIMVLNGDTLCPVDLPALLQFHAGHNGLATLTVVRNNDRKDVGGVEFDNRFVITQFSERGRQMNPYINAGIYVFERSFLNLIPKNQNISLEEQIFPKTGAGELRAFVSPAPLYDIGTPERLKFFKEIYSSGQLGFSN